MIDPQKIPTPCFVVEASLLQKNCQTLKYVMDQSGASIILALKGFAMFSTFDLVSQYLQGTTASSLHEARLGFEEFGQEVHAYSPAYLDHEFDELMQYCNHITFNSLQQWKHFKPRIQNNSKKISCGLRINPEYSEVGTDLYNPAAPGSRLGIPVEEIGPELPDGIEGIHFHTLFESGADILERTLQHIEGKAGHLLHQARWFNLGGGHGITKKDYDLELLIYLVSHLRENYQVEVIIEPGSAVAWETGSLVASILDIVEYHGRKTAILDVSFAAHMPDCIEMPYKPRIQGAHDSQPGDQFVYYMGGMTCLAGDVMGAYTFNRPLKPGDKVLFEDMIHYTMVKTTTFNGVNHPSIGIWTSEGLFKMVRKFGYQDYRNRLS
ncbi:MAG: carboxynorspermidine decarboxylase [Candidatus Cyclobacteriaceae bacterium M3_2C_046]